MKKQQEKILIVDDVSKNIQILGSILSQKDYQIAYAQNGKQAIDISKIQEFDLILLDIMMPGIDGYEVCKKLKKSPLTREVPIIFLTAKADMDSIIKGFEVGGQDYITKPFNSAELLARVENHLLIKRQREELKEINLNLEAKVKERTIELEKANHKLSVLDNAKSSFLSVISHEIRTPLNGLIGITELLNQTKIDQDQQEYIANLQEVSKRLMKFSDTALLITTLKADKYNPEILPVSVGNLIEDAISKFRLEEPDSSLKINLISPDNDLQVEADSDLVRTCFHIIIDNASRFTGKNAVLDIVLSSDENCLNIAFTDNGPGFSETSLSNLYETFSSGDIQHAEGTGLGLSAVKLALDAIEAKINIQNTDSGGAKVVITLKQYKQETKV